MIQTLPLFRPLHVKLITLLLSLERHDWARKTVAGSWSIKDVTAHLLDTTLRGIAMYRDGWTPPAPNINTYSDLVSYLNKLNADWVIAMQRVSPELLVEWLKVAHEDYVRCLETLDPMTPARFSVAWAGEESSSNWFHIAREYTEQWHHQQQIREAVGQQDILTREFYFPALDTFMRALPFQYRTTVAPDGTRISLHIDSEAGGTWQLERKSSQWHLDRSIQPADAEAFIPAPLAWKLLTKAVRYEDVSRQIRIDGERSLVLPALRMISVMA